MKKFAILAAVVALIGCAQNEEGLDNITNTPEKSQTEFYASMPECDTRTYVEDNKYLRWNAGDEITVFAGNSYNGHWQFAGEDGANSGKFNEIEEGGFVTGTPLDLTANYAIYPYDENITITEAGVVSLTLPAVQEYNHTYANSFGEGANTMMAVTENTSDNFLAFKNLCGYLKLKFYGEDVTVKSITVKGNNGEKIAGSATVAMTYGDEPTITMGDDATDTITIDCGEGVALSNDAVNPTIFWVVIPEITFEGGITIEVTDINDQTFSKTTTNAVPIENNLIQPMAALGVEVAPAGPANNEIWYTATAKVTPYKNNAFGATIVSNAWDSTTGKGVIIFDDVVSKIGNEAFCYCKDLTSIIIPNSVTMIGQSAFEDTTSLTYIDIPESVVTIANFAFWGCTSMQHISIPQSVKSLGELVFNNCTGEILINCNVPDQNSLTGAFNLSKFTKVIIGNSVSSMGNNAFLGCSNLVEVHISDIAAWCGIGFASESATPLLYGNDLYLNGALVTDLSIPDNITEIKSYAFFGCSSLASVTMHENITSITNRAFDECSNLAKIYCKSTTPPAIHYLDAYKDEGAFPFNCEMKIYIPREAYDAYMQYVYTGGLSGMTTQANWYNYESYIEPYDFE